MNYQPRLKDKRWDPKRELEVFRIWEAEDTYKFNKNSDRPIYSIDTPPPYASGKWHVGGTTHYAQIDMVARYFRMRGHEVLFPLGIDRNGLPVEVEVEKKFNIAAHETPRADFIQLCKGFLDQVEKEIIEIAKRLGLSCNFNNLYRTDSSDYRRVTQNTFIELWSRGLIYLDDRPTNWCTVCQTTIADAELEYVDKETHLCYVKFEVAEGGEIVIATTRPELICTCAVVVRHPTDERYLKLEEKHAVTPIYRKKVPITPSGYAKPEFGTGLAMMCSFGDYTDVKLFREMNLEPVIAITKEGRMNDAAGQYRGLSVKKARVKIIGDLEASGQLVKKEKIMHATPVCWRSKTPVEFINMEEYYLKQLIFLDDLKRAINLMHFHPPESKQILLNWINSISVDWPISRRRFYGTEIPVWYCVNCGKRHVPPPGKYYQPWNEKAPFEKCSCGSADFEGEARTFDTWMDSSISQLVILEYLKDEKFFDKTFPCTLRPQGVDIVRTWLYYSLLRTYQLLAAQAFKHTRLSGMGLDEHGEAMHKSKGNVIWPEPFLDTLGADALRLWGAAESKLGSNYRFSRERLEGSARFITKLWNIARFISCFPESKVNSNLTPLDRMILSELYRVIKECVSGYEQLDFFIPAQEIRSFIWNIFADHYIEAVKARAYNMDGAFQREEQQAAWYTLHTCLKTLLLLLAPISPFITDAIWRELYSNRSIHIQNFPDANEAWMSEYGKLVEPFMKLNSAIWKYKKNKGLNLNSKLRNAYIPEVLEAFKADLKSMHKIENFFFNIPAVKEKFDLVDDTYFFSA